MSVLTSFYKELQNRLVCESEHLSGQTRSSEVLGKDRETFINDVLKRSLPSNIVIDRGVIINREGSESSPQDIILYRRNFPIIANPIGERRFLVEGVVAWHALR